MRAGDATVADRRRVLRGNAVFGWHGQCEVQVARCPVPTPDVPYLWAREAVAVSGFPAGLIADSRAEVRAPLHRSDSIVFQDTYAGIGARVAVTPAFSTFGPRLSIAPVDVFDLDLQASWIGYYGTAGLLPFDQVGGKLGPERSARADQAIGAGAWQISASPTLKAKFGPVIALDSLTVARTAIQVADPGSEWVYEPFSDLVVGWTDTTLEDQAVLVVELSPADGADAFAWAGVTARERRALSSGDVSDTAGVLLRGRPARGLGVPVLTLQALAYLRDADRVGLAPSVALLGEWTFDRNLSDPGGQP